MHLLGLRHWKTFQANYLKPLLQARVVGMTLPDKPRSRMQKYRLTEAGRSLLEQTQRKHSADGAAKRRSKR